MFLCEPMALICLRWSTAWFFLRVRSLLRPDFWEAWTEAGRVPLTEVRGRVDFLV